MNDVAFHSRLRAALLRWFPVALGALCILWAGRVRAADRFAASSGGTTSLVSNGSFESPALGAGQYQYTPFASSWSFAGGAGITSNGSAFTSGNGAAPLGTQVLFLQGAGASAKMSIRLPAGLYNFSFFAAQRGNIPGNQRVQLWVNGLLRSSFTPSGSGYQSFGASSVLLASGTHQIELLGTNGQGDQTAFVDGLSFTRVRDLRINSFESPALAASSFAYMPKGGSVAFTDGAGLSRNGSGFTASNPPAPDLHQVLFLQGGGTATMNVFAPLGGYYRFRFKAALRANNPVTPCRKNVRIVVAGVPVGEFVLTSNNYIEQVSLPLYLPSGFSSLTLIGVDTASGDHTAFVDDVRMEMLHAWSDQAVWGGSLPGTYDDATVPAGSAVCMNGSVTPRSIKVYGQLLAAQNQNLDVTTKYLMVMGAGAKLEVGQDLVPYPSKATFTLNATSSDPDIMGMGTKFIGAMHQGTIHLHGENRVSWTQLAANVEPGATTLTLKEPVDWRVGDEIVVVSSRRDWNEAEERTLTAVNGNTVRLNAGLAYPHKGAIRFYTQGADRAWYADLRAQVGLLSHNIKVQGQLASPSDRFGGHIMVMGNSSAYVGGVELSRMGQEAVLGRYPFHWHMLGSVGAGQYFKNSSVHHSFNRAVTIHGTESTTVENNFCYDHIGHGIFLEDGSERFNVIRKNVVLLTRRPEPGKELTPSDNQLDQAQNRTPSSYWITNPQNTFEDNVAAGTEGTGYWFAFPQRPTGQSATDSRFSSMKPHTLPLISFKRNSAHSTMNAFDIFDQLDENHSIVPNLGWADDGTHLIDACTWYANDTALYTGIGAGGRSDNLFFTNNVFVENGVGAMFASQAAIWNSVFVANSGENLWDSTRYAYRVYDGPGRIFYSHFVGWNAENANFLLNTGGAIKHVNHVLYGNTTDTENVRIELDDFDIKTLPDAHANHPGHPRFWSVVLRDHTGGISGKANTSIVSNHPFVLVGDEYQPSNWVHAYRSDHKFALSRVAYPVPFEQTPNVTVTREKPGTASESVYYINGYKEWHQLPVIVNEGYEYTYAYATLPYPRRLEMNMQDASAGDFYVARFKDFGKLGGLSLASSQGSLPARSSLAQLRSSSSSSYFVEPNGDLYIKAVATGSDQSFSVQWTTGFAPFVIDSDGDGMGDAGEVSVNFDPFAPGDLLSEFNGASRDGWNFAENVADLSVSGSVLRGVASGNGDAILHNGNYNFRADGVRQLFVRMRASQATGVEVFFATDTQPAYAATRRVSTVYTGTGGYETLVFDVGSHPDWQGTITDLRLDPVSGVGISFEIDRISAWCEGNDDDSDGVCDEVDRCPLLDDQRIGTSCNDGNPATFPDAWSASCICEGGSF